MKEIENTFDMFPVTTNGWRIGSYSCDESAASMIIKDIDGRIKSELIYEIEYKYMNLKPVVHTSF